MPGFTTHCLFARDIQNTLKDDVTRDIINERMSLFYLGAQGPDVFFYYKVKPWVKYDGIEKLGFLMHDNKTGEFFIEFLDYLMSLKKGSETYFEIKTYLIGYICHFVLDKTTHPLIHYTAGINTSNNKSTFKYHIYHKQLESIIDAYMLKIKDGSDLHRFRDFEFISNISDYRQSIERFYIQILKKVFGVNIRPAQIDIMISDIQDILKILYDPYGVKLLFFKVFEYLYKRKGEVVSSMHPRKINRHIDYLNLSHRKWHHPCDKTLRSDRSFIDLYGEAIKEALAMVKVCEHYINNPGTPKSVIIDLLKNISYSTGISCGNEKKLKDFNSIFENPRYFTDDAKIPGQLFQQ